MGIGYSTKSSPKIYNTDELEYYETSCESWIFNERHVEAIKYSLGQIQLDFSINIILSYLGNVNKETNFKWNHFNYTTYIHPKETPLNNNTKPLNQDWIQEKYSKCSYSNSSDCINVVMLGGGGVGKSAITIRFVTDNFLDEYDPTIEDTYRRTIITNVAKNDYDKFDVTLNSKTNAKIASQSVLIDILDTAGREEFSSMQDQWIRSGQIFLVVFSVVYRETFDEVQMIQERILRCKDENTDCVMIAVGNKCDLRVDGNVSRYGYGGRSGCDVDMDEVHNWCTEHEIPYIETSAKEGKNINFLYRQAIYEFYRLRLDKK